MHLREGCARAGGASARTSRALLGTVSTETGDQPPAFRGDTRGTCTEEPVTDGTGGTLSAWGLRWSPQRCARRSHRAGDAPGCRGKPGGGVGNVYPSAGSQARVYFNMQRSSDANMQMAGLGCCTYISCWSVTANRGRAHICAASFSRRGAWPPGERTVCFGVRWGCAGRSASPGW